ncbi:MAG: hypothetical protein FJ302_18420 [Planctomycetes bacterium]|nr:hypothetical protein [Planctomycetota bacterium]
MAAVYSLAFESDSTRIVTLMVDAFKTFVFALPIQKATIESYHGLWFEHRRGDLRQADRHRHRAGASSSRSAISKFAAGFDSSGQVNSLT